MSVIHKKHSTAVGSDDPNKVHPSDWNDEHVNADGTPVTAMRVIGPVPIAFDDQGGVYVGEESTTLADGATIAVINLQAGLLVMKAWAQPRVPFNGGMNGLQLLITGTDPILGSTLMSTWWMLGSTDGYGRYDWAEEKTDDPGVPRIFRVIEDCRICVSKDGGTPTAGEADVYALIADPA